MATFFVSCFTAGWTLSPKLLISPRFLSNGFSPEISLKSFFCHLISVNCESFFRRALNMSVERHPFFLLFSVRLRLDAFLMPQNALSEFPGCHGAASDAEEKADQINPCSNRKAVAKPPAECQTKKKRRHKGQSELCQHCEIGNHPRPLLHILSLSAVSFCQTFGSVSCFIFPKHTSIFVTA